MLSGFFPSSRRAKISFVMSQAEPKNAYKKSVRFLLFILLIKRNCISRKPGYTIHKKTICASGKAFSLFTTCE
jgi:hypothetical protein